MSTETTLEAVLANLPQSNSETASLLAQEKQSPNQSEPQNENGESKPKETPSRLAEAALKAILHRPEDKEFRAKWLKLKEDHHPRARKLACWTESWIKAAAANKRPVGRPPWVIFAGKTGTGKSHALKAAYRFMRAHSGAMWPKFWKHPVSLKFVVWSKAVAFERYAWDDFEEEIRGSDMVFVDDLGSEIDRFKSGEPAERLRLFLDLAKTKWMLVSTNIPREDFPKAFDARVVSRLEAAQTLDLSEAPDFRPRLQEGAKETQETAS